MPAHPLACLALPLALAAPLSGCAALLHRVERPKAKVAAVSIRTVRLTGLRAEVDLQVFNPNQFALPLTNVDWTLAIGGAPAARGQVAVERSIPARGSAPVKVSVAVDALDAAAVAGRIAEGQRRYHLHAVLHFSTEIGRLDVALDDDGPLSHPPLGALIPRPRAAGTL